MTGLRERDEDEKRELEEEWRRKEIAHGERIAADADNIKNIGDFTGGKKIIFTVPTRDCDEVSDMWWIGKTGMCTSHENVSPNAIRRGNGKPNYYIWNDCEPIGGNSNQNITRYFGWRGTTNDISVEAHGVRMVEKIVQFKNHARIYISKYNRKYTD